MSGTIIQIAGMPRSGTAFLAAFLSLHPKCVANHELAATDPNWKETIRDQLEHWEYVIDSTTYGWIPKATFDRGRRVGLVREPSESALRSSEAFGYPVDQGSMEFCYDQITEWSWEWLRIDYSELFTVESLRSIWVYCFGNSNYFSEEKARLFISLNIQRMNPEIVFSKENSNERLKEVV